MLPGDAPAAGRAAMVLLSALQSSTAWAVVAVDRSGRAQPLQLALRPPAAKALIAAAGRRARRQSARRLVDRLSPAAQRVPVSAEDHFDIDTADQLLSWSCATAQTYGLFSTSSMRGG